MNFEKKKFSEWVELGRKVEKTPTKARTYYEKLLVAFQI
jgi:hypothetical protein